MADMKTSFSDAKFPNLNRIYITRDGFRNNGDNYEVPELNHSKIETFYYRI